MAATIGETKPQVGIVKLQIKEWAVIVRYGSGSGRRRDVPIKIVRSRMQLDWGELQPRVSCTGCPRDAEWLHRTYISCALEASAHCCFSYV